MSQSPDIMPDPSSGLSTIESVRLVHRAVVNGWDIKPEWKQVIPKFAMQILADTSRKERDRLRAMELIRAMERDNLDAAVAYDKINRLESGQTTENVGTITLSFDKGG